MGCCTHRVVCIAVKVLFPMIPSQSASKEATLSVAEQMACLASGKLEKNEKIREKESKVKFRLPASCQ